MSVLALNILFRSEMTRIFLVMSFPATTGNLQFLNDNFHHLKLNIAVKMWIETALNDIRFPPPRE